jgi:hypothetical protein
MAAALSLTLGLAACAAPQGAGTGVSAAPVRVTNGGLPFANHEGAAAKRVAMETCAAQGGALRTSIYDRFEAGTWVFVEGCA